MISLALAATASLVLSPITWFHYPVVLLPFGALAWVAAREVGPAARRVAAILLGGAVIVAGAAIVAPVLVWLAVASVLVALGRSGLSPADTTDASGGLAHGS